MEVVDAEDVNGHVVLRGAEKFLYEGFVGMLVFRSEGMSFATVAEGYADGWTVIPVKAMTFETWGRCFTAKVLCVVLLPARFLSQSCGYLQGSRLPVSCPRTCHF